MERVPVLQTPDKDPDTAMEIKDNPDTHRFETVIGDQTAFVEYRRTDDRITLAHTMVPPSLEGKGIGTALAKYSLDFARQNSLKVIPSCPFIAEYIEAHPEYADLTD